MPMIKIDDKEYNIDTLSEEAKNQIASIQFVDAELARLGLVDALRLSTLRLIQPVFFCENEFADN